MCYTYPCAFVCVCVYFKSWYRTNIIPDGTLVQSLRNIPEEHRYVSTVSLMPPVYVNLHYGNRGIENHVRDVRDISKFLIKISSVTVSLQRYREIESGGVHLSRSIEYIA